MAKPKAGTKKAAKVFFCNLRSRSAGENKVSKIKKLFKEAGFDKLFTKDMLTAIKMHFGERGNDTFIKPMFARAVVDKLKEAGARPFLTDSNTLYKGSRHNAVDHLETALEHGFGYATVGAPLMISDGLRGGSFSEIAINKKHFEKVKIADAIIEAGGMMVLSHFKGHEMAGFGGAIKNMAMGCAPSQGKRDQHAARFTVQEELCIHCGRCIANCPQNAISWVKREKGKVASISKDACVGCGECLTVCGPKAVTIDWASEMVPFNERMAEYAYGAVCTKEGRVGYINFLMNITPDCDCVPWSDAPIVADIGILASLDPVALDQACFDLVSKAQSLEGSMLGGELGGGTDKFKGLWDYTTAEAQLSHAEAIGLGTKAYTLVEVS